MKHFFTLTLLLMALFCQSQDVAFKAANFKDDKDGLKAAIDAIKQGDEQLTLGNDAVALVNDPGDAFFKALSFYIKAQQFNPDNAELNMKIGNCYLYTTDRAKATPYIEKAVQLNPDISPFLHFLYGQVLQLKEEWETAIKEYKLFEEQGKNKHVEEYKKLTGKYKKECKNGMILKAQKLRVWVDNMEYLNSPGDELNPCITADEETMLFSSNRKNQHPADDLGRYDFEIYQCNKTVNGWSKANNIGQPLNTEQDESVSALAYDGQRLLMSIKADGNYDVYESKLMGVSWGKPQRKMSKVVNTTNNETGACYEPLDIKVFYIYDGNSRGDKDIYFSGLRVEGDNLWGKGQTAGHQICTQFHEGSVYIHPDGQTMYFSSQGHNSMGGYDIFMSTKDENGQWKPPVNMGYPINTPYDEMFFAVTANGKFAYIASNRAEGKGGMDLYKVTFWGPEKPVVVSTEDYLLASIAKPVKDNNVKATVAVERKSLTVFKGKTIDHLTSKPVQADIEITDNKLGKVIRHFSSNGATGKFLLTLPGGYNYGIAVNADGYLFHSENFDVPAKGAYDMVDKTIALKNIAIGSKIALRNVFFATGKSNIIPESYPELNRLVQLLNDVPSLKIELSGHTDNTGSESLNRKLSQSRADAVMQYLISKGISKSRLTAKGYASDQPIASNNTAEGRSLNRRTEFEITGN